MRITGTFIWIGGKKSVENFGPEKSFPELLKDKRDIPGMYGMADNERKMVWLIGR